MTWWMWTYVIVALVVACCLFGMGVVAVVKERSSVTGRYTARDARMILFLFTLGPLVIAPLWLPALFVGAFGFYAYTLKKVGEDAHLEELAPEWMEKRAVYKKYQALKEQNSRLEKELEAKSHD